MRAAAAGRRHAAEGGDQADGRQVTVEASDRRAAEGKAAQLVAQLLELPNAKPVALCESLLASSTLEAKLELSRRLQKMMTPSEVREALTDLIERLKGDELVALLAGAFGELQPRERHALLQGALKALENLFLNSNKIGDEGVRHLGGRVLERRGEPARLLVAPAELAAV